MTHLSPGQVVDVAEGGADAVLASHARDCGACRAKVEAVAGALRLARSDPPPEPSPLFWPHLAARISSEVRREQARAPRWRAPVWRLAPIGAAAVVVVALGIGAWLRPAPPTRENPASDSFVETPAQAGDDSMADGEPADDPAWTLVSDLSAEVSVEDADASGALPPPGGAEKALADLNAAERGELTRILREEIAAWAPAAPQGPGA
ncbi:MAG: hypothetical protein H6Q10_1951 [Acidobacteria bacterium]|jgi:hypothetical protein|nr:hypothetical protein [Acidobacteriota bacterium]